MIERLEELTEQGNFRAKVEAVIINANTGRGMQLKIADALRTPERQAEKVKKGFSKTMRSKHLAGSDGLARAADIVDARYGWDAPKDVWVLIGRLALTQGLGWGGLWGLPFVMRSKFEDFLLDRSVPFDPKKWAGKLGWDVAHLEKR